MIRLRLRCFLSPLSYMSFLYRLFSHILQKQKKRGVHGWVDFTFLSSIAGQILFFGHYVSRPLECLIVALLGSCLVNYCSRDKCYGSYVHLKMISYDSSCSSHSIQFSLRSCGSSLQSSKLFSWFTVMWVTRISYGG